MSRDNAAEADRTPEEVSVIASLTQSIEDLQERLVAALKKANQYMDETVEAREQFLMASDFAEKLSDQLKVQVENNLKLHEKVLALQMENNLARNEALALENQAMTLEKQRLDKKVEKAKKQQLLQRELLAVEMAKRGQ